MNVMCISASIAFAAGAHAERLKDLASIQGVCQNQSMLTRFFLSVVPL